MRPLFQHTHVTYAGTLFYPGMAAPTLDFRVHPQIEKADWGTNMSNPSTDTLKGIRVLVVEDERDTRDLLDIMLTSHGAECSIADTVFDGLSVLRQENIDVVLTDIGMPEYNGYALVGSIRKHTRPSIRNMPVIALTAYATPADRDTGLISGFNAYLTKPFDLAELVNTIKRLYDQRKERAA